MTASTPDLAATLLLADPRLPTGGHTDSAGWEPAVLAGCTTRDVADYLQVRLRTTGSVDASIAAFAHLAYRLAEPAECGEKLARVHAHWAARTPSQVQRAAAEALGSGQLRLLRRLWPEHPVTALAAGVATPARPLTLAALATVLGCDVEETVQVLLYDEVQTVTSAALKLLPLDPADAVAWTLAARATIGDVAAAALTAVAGGWAALEALAAPSAPLVEQWAHEHARAPRRFFRA